LSSAILPFDIEEVVGTELKSDRRENDGLLHASSLLAPERHAQLTIAGAPTREEDPVSLTRMLAGTLLHDWLQERLRKLGMMAMFEVDLTPFMPAGWSGRCDALFYNPKLKAWTLLDIKTTQGPGMRYIMNGPKAEHLAQTSAYWYAAKASGLPMVKTVGILYWPITAGGKYDNVSPTMVTFAPMDEADLIPAMKERTKRAKAYLKSLPKPNPRPLTIEEYLTPKLAPESERTQIAYSNKDGTYDVLLKPHWLTAYCPFEGTGLCDCSEQGQTKIGVYDVDGTFYPRTGFEDVAVTVEFPG
jgi:hypothetical protein